MPKIAYHTCSMQNFFDIVYVGIFPGGMGDRQSSRGHAYLTVVPPWDRHGRKAGGARADWPINIAVDVEMLIQLGCRLYAPGDGEAFVTEDWITNQVIIYAYDAKYARFIWSNRMYVSLRRNYQDSIKKFREDVKNGEDATPVIESFMVKVDKECKLYYKQWAPTADREMGREGGGREGGREREGEGGREREGEGGREGEVLVEDILDPPILCGLVPSLPPFLCKPEVRERAR